MREITTKKELLRERQGQDGDDLPRPPVDGRQQNSFSGGGRLLLLPSAPPPPPPTPATFVPTPLPRLTLQKSQD